MNSRDILRHFLLLVHIIITISPKWSAIKKDVDHLVNVYKLRVALCKSSGSQTLEIHLEEIDLYIRTIQRLRTAQVKLEGKHEALK